MKLSAIISLLAAYNTSTVASSSDQQVNAFDEPSYGVDVSFPVHYKRLVPDIGEDFYVNRQEIYNEFMDGCRKHYPDNPKSCDVTEQDRVDMSLRQPASMQNYTNMGFKKVKARTCI